MELHELPNKAIFFAKGNCFLHKKARSMVLIYEDYIYSNMNQPLLYYSNNKQTKINFVKPTNFS